MPLVSIRLKLRKEQRPSKSNKQIDQVKQARMEYFYSCTCLQHISMAVEPLMFQGINAISKRHAALPRQPAARIPLVLPEADRWRFEVAFTSSPSFVLPQARGLCALIQY